MPLRGPQLVPPLSTYPPGQGVLGQLVVFDVDGTLADVTHRLPLLMSKDWDAFFAACGGDAPIHQGLAALLSFYNAGHEIELWTGRPERVREKTEQWLALHAWPVRGWTLRMRADGDHRPDHEVKPEYLKQCPRRPFLIFEDRASMVQEWRSRGLTCYQVAEGAF